VWSYRCVSANDLAALDRLAETGEAPRDETKEKRLREALDLLASGKKLGLK
jgi:hypothetical protein